MSASKGHALSTWRDALICALEAQGNQPLVKPFVTIG